MRNQRRHLHDAAEADRESNQHRQRPSAAGAALQGPRTKTKSDMILNSKNQPYSEDFNEGEVGTFLAKFKRVKVYIFSQK